MNPQIEQSVKQYIHAYNNFDIDGMLVKLDPAIVFKNISHGEVDFITEGLDEFICRSISLYKKLLVNYE